MIPAIPMPSIGGQPPDTLHRCPGGIPPASGGLELKHSHAGPATRSRISSIHHEFPIRGCRRFGKDLKT